MPKPMPKAALPTHAASGTSGVRRAAGGELETPFNKTVAHICGP